MGTRSEVWILASKLNSQEAQCNLCHKVIKFCGTSTNVRRHLQKCHHEAYSEVQKRSHESEKDESLGSEDDNPSIPNTSAASAGVKRKSNIRTKSQKGIMKIFKPDTTIEPELEISILNPISSTEAPNDNVEEIFVMIRDNDPLELQMNEPTLSSPRNNEEIELHINDPSLSSPSVELEHATVTSSLSANSMDSNEAELSAPLKQFNLKNNKMTSTIKDCFQKIQSFKRGGEMDAKVTSALVYLVVKNCLPFSIEESDGFQNLMSIVSPHYIIPCATTMKTAIDRKYNALFELEKKRLSSVKNFALTVDVWTESHSLCSVLGVTAHYVHYDGKLKSVVLGSTELTERHLADVIAAHIKQILDKWDIRIDQITAITTDNGANIVSAVRSLVGDDRHISCLAHTLNLILTAAFKDENINAVVKSVRDIVTWLDTSCIAACERKKVEDLCLLQTYPTRWNSTYYVLKRFLQMKSTISEILPSHTNTSIPQMINGDAIAVIEDLLPTLELFDSITKECSKERTVSVSRIIPIVDYMSTKLDALVPTTENGKKFLNVVKKDFEKHFGDVESNYLLSICTLLDPRYKKIHFKNALRCSKAVSQLKNLMNENENTGLHINENGLPVGDDTSQLTDLDKFTTSKSQLTSQFRPCELTQYLRSATADITTDPLQYWWINRHEYPKLHAIAKRLLCVQGSSTPCEQLFSIAGFIMNARRNRIKMESLEKLLFLKNLTREQWQI